MSGIKNKTRVSTRSTKWSEIKGEFMSDKYEDKEIPSERIRGYIGKDLWERKALIDADDVRRELDKLHTDLRNEGMIRKNLGAGIWAEIEKLQKRVDEFI